MPSAVPLPPLRPLRPQACIHRVQAQWAISWRKVLALRTRAHTHTSCFSSAISSHHSTAMLLLGIMAAQDLPGPSPWGRVSPRALLWHSGCGS